MKFTVAFSIIFLVNSIFAQKSCKELSKKSIQEQDNLNIKARLGYFSLGVKSRNYENVKSTCKDLVDDLHTVMDPVVEILADCPEEKDVVEAGTFKVAFVCSVDNDRIEAILSGANLPINRACRQQFQNDCIANNLDFCSDQYIDALITCAREKLDPACSDNIEFFSRILNFAKESRYCEDGKFLQRRLHGF